MAFAHGKDTIAAYNQWNMTSGMRDLNLSYIKELVDITHLGNRDRNYLEGLRTQTARASGIYDNSNNTFSKTVQNLFDSTSETINYFSCAFSKINTGQNAFITEAIPVSFSEVAPLTDSVMVESEFQLTELPIKAHLIHNGPLTTSGDGNTGEWIDLGASAAYTNLIWRMHIIAKPAATTNVTLEHTDDISGTPTVVTLRTESVESTDNVTNDASWPSSVTINRYLRIKGSTTQAMSVMAFLHLSS